MKTLRGLKKVTLEYPVKGLFVAAKPNGSFLCSQGAGYSFIFRRDNVK